MWNGRATSTTYCLSEYSVNKDENVVAYLKNNNCIRNDKIPNEVIKCNALTYSNYEDALDIQYRSKGDSG